MSILQAPLILSTGAIARYPLQRKIDFATRSIKFADFSRQTFAQLANPLSKWTLNLNLMQDSEVADWVDFLKTVQGNATPFSFIDPWDNLLQYSEAQDQPSWIYSTNCFVGSNYVLQSQDFSSAVWNPTSNTSPIPVVSAGTVAAPDGTNTANQVVFPSINPTDDWSILQQVGFGNAPSAGLPLTFSVWVHATGSGQIMLMFRQSDGSNGVHNVFNLSAGWQRISLTNPFTSATPAENLAAWIGLSTNDGSPMANTGITVNLWGAQVEYGSVASDYSATTTSSEILQVADPFFIQAPVNTPGYQWNLNSALPRRGRQIVFANSPSESFVAQTSQWTLGGYGLSRRYGLTLTGSLYAKAQGASGQIQLEVHGDLDAGLFPFTPSSAWSRISGTKQFLASDRSVCTIGLANYLSLSTVYVFGFQLETCAALSPYKKTTSYCGYHPICYLSDELSHAASEYNVNNLDQVVIEESN